MISLFNPNSYDVMPEFVKWEYVSLLQRHRKCKTISLKTKLLHNVLQIKFMELHCCLVGKRSRPSYMLASCFGKEESPRNLKICDPPISFHRPGLLVQVQHTNPYLKSVG